MKGVGTLKDTPPLLNDGFELLKELVLNVDAFIDGSKPKPAELS